MLIARAILHAALARGMDEAELLREAGLSPEWLGRAGDEIPLASTDALWRGASRDAGSGFGLEVAELMGRGALGGIEYAFRASHTLGEGLRILARYTRLLHARGGYSLRPGPGASTSLVYESVHASDVEALAVDFALAAVLRLARDATGASLHPRRVLLRRENGVLARHSAFFGAPIELAEENALELGPELLALRMLAADPMLCTILDGYLSVELESRDPAQSLADAVRAAILAGLPEQRADLENVAARLGLSARVLQKRLQQADTSFQTLLDQVREQVAKRELLQPGVSLADLALRLGYSDVTAFHRAFKRWTGVTPGELRRGRSGGE